MTIDELLLLALALEVPPLFLFLPIAGDEALKISPTAQLRVTDAVAWVQGDTVGLSHLVDALPTNVKEWRRHMAEAMPLNALHSMWMYLQLVRLAESDDDSMKMAAQRVAEERGEDPEQVRMEIFQEAINGVAWGVDILGSAGLAPPPLPGRIVEALKEGSLLKRPLAYQGDLPISDEET